MVTASRLLSAPAGALARRARPGPPAVGTPGLRGAADVAACLGVVVPLLALLGATLSVLADRGYVVVHQCVALPGAWRVLGMHLALVRESPDCPLGSAALGGDPTSAAGVLGVLAVPVLVVHVLALLTGWGATTALRRGLARLGGLTGARRLRRLAGLPGHRVVVPAGPRTTPVVDAPLRRLHHVVLGHVQTLRGPPAAALAV